MKTMLDIATVLGGIAALCFFWDRVVASRLPQKQTSIAAPKQPSDLYNANTGTGYQERIGSPQKLNAKWSFEYPQWVRILNPILCTVACIAVILIEINFSAETLMKSALAGLVPGTLGLILDDNNHKKNIAMLLMSFGGIILLVGAFGSFMELLFGFYISEASIGFPYVIFSIFVAISLGVLVTSDRKRLRAKESLTRTQEFDKRKEQFIASIRKGKN